MEVSEDQPPVVERQEKTNKQKKKQGSWEKKVKFTERKGIKQKGKKAGKRREEKEWRERPLHQERLSQVEGGESHGKHIGMDPSPQTLSNTDLHTTHTCTLHFDKSLLAKAT